jgi:segregation and condensation protein A
MTSDWSVLDDYLIAFIADPSMRRTVRATSLSATLELVKVGRAEIRQERTFAPIEMRAIRNAPERSVA